MKTLTFILTATLSLSFILSGCGTSQTTPVEPTQALPETPLSTNTPLPTDTPVPTDTPSPTDTPEPTSTNTPIPTDTPDLEATAAVEATATAEAVEAAIIEEMNRLEIAPLTGSLAWVQDEPIILNAEGGSAYNVTSFAEGQKFSDFIIKADITWNSEGGAAGCVILFRSEPNLETGDNYSFNTLRISGLPLWDIELWQDGQWSTTLGGRARSHEAIKLEQGATNTYIIKAEKDLFTVWANDDRLSRLQSGTLSDGYMGFGVWQDSGVTKCEMANAWIWSLK